MSLDFNIIKTAIQHQFNKMKNMKLYRVNIDTDKLWQTYLKAFPPGTDPKYRERSEHDCSICRHFIRDAGTIVAINGDKLISVWDVDIEGPYKIVADKMSELIKSCPIASVYMHYERRVGVDKTLSKTEAGTITYNHFVLYLPESVVKDKYDIPSALSNINATKDVMSRSLQEITIDALETVQELINQNSLYRGQEHKYLVDEFLRLKKEYNKANNKEYFCWSNIDLSQALLRIKNTVIGTLLMDLSEGKDLEDAVKAFESKVAPTNYKRPTALVTKGMIQAAQKQVEELGYETALERRYAVLEDITINNVLFADRSARKKMNTVFDEMINEKGTTISKKTLDKAEEIHIDKFVSDVLPKIKSMEVMVENNHIPHLVSLIAPKNPTSKSMLKWANNFSWSYNGGLTDSIKERVKKAGGKVDGDFRASLSWYNYDDLDLYLIEPGGDEIFYAQKHSYNTGGRLDVDMNAGTGSTRTRTPVENIFYPNKSRMQIGTYILRVHQFCKRENKDFGFEVEMEFEGQVYNFVYDKAVTNRQFIEIAKFKYDPKSGFSIISSLPSTKKSKNAWNIETNQLQKVSVMMLSPNYWDTQTVGNKHYFFMLENCINDGEARGFYNEFLSESLTPHRKVFEILGSKMKVEPSQNQLSGLGFSSTQRNSLLCKVDGSFSRYLKIIF